MGVTPDWRGEAGPELDIVPPPAGACLLTLASAAERTAAISSAADGAEPAPVVSASGSAAGASAVVALFCTGFDAIAPAAFKHWHLGVWQMWSKARPAFDSGAYPISSGFQTMVLKTAIGKYSA